MGAHNKVDIFNLYKALKLQGSYEELSIINVVDTDSKSSLTPSWSPPENDLKNVVKVEEKVGTYTFVVNDQFWTEGLTKKNPSWKVTDSGSGVMLCCNNKSGIFQEATRYGHSTTLAKVQWCTQVKLEQRLKAKLRPLMARKRREAKWRKGRSSTPPLVLPQA
ncbi:hypothetical protein HAX54_013915 [Datura stramonium]|uniref:Uncharacterized protein n=1 Tax=Datura stramonium TaxID=4076 RepID=A0ABS8RYH9_DATST|nr:hypothetical protein [Datura stramonium]